MNIYLDPFAAGLITGFILGIISLVAFALFYERREKKK